MKREGRGLRAEGGGPENGQILTAVRLPNQFRHCGERRDPLERKVQLAATYVRHFSLASALSPQPPAHPSCGASP
jgi:hypothetical protein